MSYSSPINSRIKMLITIHSSSIELRYYVSMIHSICFDSKKKAESRVSSLLSPHRKNFKTFLLFVLLENTFDSNDSREMFAKILAESEKIILAKKAKAKKEEWIEIVLKARLMEWKILHRKKIVSIVFLFGYHPMKRSFTELQWQLFYLREHLDFLFIVVFKISIIPSLFVPIEKKFLFNVASSRLQQERKTVFKQKCQLLMKRL